MMKKIFKLIALAACFVALLSGCKKYLEAKPDKQISTPDKLSDLQGILDGYFTMNAQYPSAGEVAASDYFVTDANWSSATEKQRNLYLWQKYDEIATDWTGPYKCIFNSNLILETIPRLELQAQEQKAAFVLKGQALFIRAYYHYAIAQLFAPAYQLSGDNKGLGIPLKLTTDIETPSTRASIADTYKQILSDAKSAIQYLPETAKSKYLPSRPAGYAFLARLSLLMGDYKLASLYADSCLQLSNSLMDYNKISAAVASPFTQFNEEVLYDCRSSAPAILSQTRAKVDPMIYASYDSNDLRKTIYFKRNTDGTYSFKGNYTGLSNAAVFSGLTSSEVVLIRAEAGIRIGFVKEGIEYLNKLLKMRYKTGSYSAMPVPSDQQALKAVLAERRKELLFRNLRWGDLRRLNQQKDFEQILIRVIRGVEYKLPPNDIRYVMLIEKRAILFSGMQQNP